MAEKRGKQKRFAKLLGVSIQHMNDIMNRRRRPSPEMAVQLEELTGVDRRAWLWPDDFENPLLKKATARAVSSPARPRKTRRDCQSKDISRRGPASPDEGTSEPVTPGGERILFGEP
jgi:DNA-binding transcriptional regulator YdaS (Cro superfamily)